MDTYEKFKSILAYLQKDVPDLQIRYKDKSVLMKVLGILLFFNRGFMTKYITTIGSTIYYPSEKSLMEDLVGSSSVLAHEYVHAKDSKRYGRLLFSLMYLFPQILALISILAIPAFFISWKVALIFAIFLIFAAPFPAYWRSRLELRGYSMTLFVANKYFKSLGLDETNRAANLFKIADKINSGEFIGSGYYWMWPFGVKKNLYDAVEQIQSGDILESDEIFVIVNSAINATCDSKNESI